MKKSLVILVGLMVLSAVFVGAYSVVDSFFVNVWVEGDLRGDLGVLSIDSSVDLNGMDLYNVDRVVVNGAYSGTCYGGLVVEDGIVVGCKPLPKPVVVDYGVYGVYR